MKKILPIALITLMSAPAGAASFLDARFAGGTLDAEDRFDRVETEGEGFTLSTEGEISPDAFIRASYAHTRNDKFRLNGVHYNNIDTDLDISRVGIGLQGGQGIRVFGALEYINTNIKVDGGGFVDEDNQDGLVLSGGLRDDGSGPFLWNIELGYVGLENSDGGTMAFDVGVRLTPMLDVVLGGQYYSFEDDNNVQTDIGIGTLGLRFEFY